jgi:hypothetical protein
MPFPIEPPIATVAPATTDPLAPHN